MLGTSSAPMRLLAYPQETLRAWERMRGERSSDSPPLLVRARSNSFLHHHPLPHPSTSTHPEPRARQDKCLWQLFLTSAASGNSCSAHRGAAISPIPLARAALPSSGRRDNSTETGFFPSGKETAFIQAAEIGQPPRRGGSTNTQQTDKQNQVLG